MYDVCIKYSIWKSDLNMMWCFFLSITSSSFYILKKKSNCQTRGARTHTNFLKIMFIGGKMIKKKLNQTHIYLLNKHDEQMKKKKPGNVSICFGHCFVFRSLLIKKQKRERERKKTFEYIWPFFSFFISSCHEHSLLYIHHGYLFPLFFFLSSSSSMHIFHIFSSFEYQKFLTLHSFHFIWWLLIDWRLFITWNIHYDHHHHHIDVTPYGFFFLLKEFCYFFLQSYRLFLLLLLLLLFPVTIENHYQTLLSCRNQ